MVYVYRFGLIFEVQFYSGYTNYIIFLTGFLQ